jgi:hypothetical protein
MASADAWSNSCQRELVEEASDSPEAVALQRLNHVEPDTLDIDS